VYILSEAYLPGNFNLISGATLGEGTGATMSDDEDDMQLEYSLDQPGGDAHDMMGFGPLLPTESERSLMERVRHELKLELKQVKFTYKLLTHCSFFWWKKFCSD